METDLEDVAQLVCNLPLLVVQFILAQTASFVPRHVINCSPVRNRKLNHIERRVPPGGNIAQHLFRCQLQPVKNLEPRWEEDRRGVHDCK